MGPPIPVFTSICDPNTIVTKTIHGREPDFFSEIQSRLGGDLQVPEDAIIEWKDDPQPASSLRDATVSLVVLSTKFRFRQHRATTRP